MCQVVQTTEDALTTRLLQATIHTLELYGIYLGKELGLYEALKFDGGSRRLSWRAPPASPPATPANGSSSRRSRDSCASNRPPHRRRRGGTGSRPSTRTSWSPRTILRTLPRWRRWSPASVGRFERVVNAYRSGGGVAYPHFGAAFRAGQAGINRPAFLSDLVARWIPALPDLHSALMSTRMRVADVGCGAGWSTLAMAKAFPQAEVVGFDADPASVHDAQRNAAAHGVAVRFEIRDAAAVAEDGPFDLVLVLEALHDMARPDEALRAIREALAPGGSVLVADEKVGDHFHAPADDLERLMYGWSIVHCLPVAMAEQPSAAIGTVIRAATVQALATGAGFPRVEVVPVDGGLLPPVSVTCAVSVSGCCSWEPRTPRRA